MKHPFLCVFMVCALTMATAHPFVNLNAAEIWNSGTKNNSGKYYNNPKTGQDGDGKYYNDTGKTYEGTYKPGARKKLNALHAFSGAKKSGRKESKLWSLMSPSAIASRNADTDYALQKEYERAKRNDELMKKVYADNEEEYYKALLRHQDRVGENLRMKNKAKEDREKKKLRAFKQLSNGSFYRPSPKYTAGEDNKNPMGLKKPKRLYNDPNL